MPFDPDALDRRDPELIAAVRPWLERFARGYLRMEVDGAHHLPDGPALLVGNHNGGIAGPDLACTMTILWRRYPVVYALAHDFAMRQLRPLGRILQRFGAVRAAPENARRILTGGGVALVYPGGDLEAYRASRDRDRVILGERTGFVRIARETGAAIVPIVARGAHRSAWIVDDGRAIARALRLQDRARVARFPIALALPWGLALGPWIPYLPLPFPIQMRVLAPIRVAEGDDPAEVRETVRARMQEALLA